MAPTRSAQEKLYESLIKYGGFTVIVSANIGEMEAEGRDGGIKCIGAPFEIDFQPEQLDTLKISYNTFKIKQ